MTPWIDPQGGFQQKAAVLHSEFTAVNSLLWNSERTIVKALRTRCMLMMAMEGIAVNNGSPRVLINDLWAFSFLHEFLEPRIVTPGHWGPRPQKNKDAPRSSNGVYTEAIQVFHLCGFTKISLQSYGRSFPRWSHRLLCFDYKESKVFMTVTTEFLLFVRRLIM